MKLIVLGTGCAKCRQLYRNVQQAIAETGVDAEVSKQEDIMEIMRYNVFSLPCLVKDGAVVADGVLSVSDLKKLIDK